MRITIVLNLQNDTRLDGVQQVQLRCAIEKIVDELKSQRIVCQGYELKTVEPPTPRTSSHDCCGAWCADCF